MAMTILLEVRWDGTNWTDESTYLWDYDVTVGMPTDRTLFIKAIAQPGEAIFTLNNGTRRFSKGQSLFNSNDPIGARVRLTINSQVCFFGFVRDVRVHPGQYNQQLMQLFCDDWMALVYRTPLSVVYDDSKPVDEGVGALFSAVYSWQASEEIGGDIDDNGDVIDHWGRAWTLDKQTAADALQHIAVSFQGRAFVTRGGVFTYRSRTALQEENTSHDLVINNDKQIVYFEPKISRENLTNRLILTVHPPDLTGVSNVVLWKANSVISVAGNSTRVISTPFRDPSTGVFITSGNVANLTATTDYLINTRTDGTGQNMTLAGGITITQTKEARRCVITIQNDRDRTMYFTKLQVRGIPIYSYDPIIMEFVGDSYLDFGYITEYLDLPVLSDVSWAEQLGQYLVDFYGSPFWFGSKLIVRGDLGNIGGVNPYAIDLLEQIKITETQSGFTDIIHRVRRVNYQWVKERDQHLIEFDLEPTPATTGHQFLIWDEGDWDERYWGL